MSVARDDPKPVPQRRGYRPALDGLRALAALWVVAYHCWIRTGAGSLDGLEPLAPLIRSGALGVEVFFVLSGFVLALGLLERASGPDAWRPFLLRRAARLLPAVWVVLVVAVVTAGLHQPDTGAVRRGLTPESVVANATLLGGVGRLLPGYEGAIGFAVDPVVWSLTPELLFSLVVVFVLAAFAWRPAVVVSLLLAGGAALRASGASVELLSVVSPLMTAFPVGVGLAVLVHRGPPGRAAARWLGAAGAAALLAVAVTRPGTTAAGLKLEFADSAWLPILVAAAAGALCVACADASATRLGVRPLPLLGRWSYGIYLWHFPIIGLLVWSLGVPHDGSTGAFLLALAAATPLAVLAGAASYRFVESPPRRWARARLSRSGRTAPFESTPAGDRAL